MFKVTAAAGFAVGMFAVAAHASVITETFTVSAATPAFTVDLSVPSFNTGLGTLTAVAITADTTETADLEVVNFNATKTGSFSSSTIAVPIMITGPLGTMLNASVLTNPVSGSVSKRVGAVPGTTTISGLTDTTSSTLNVSSADFGGFERPPGGHSYTLSFVAGDTVVTGTKLTGPPPNHFSTELFFGGDAEVGGTVTVQYTYTPVISTPEPASIAVLGVGVAGLIGFARRRKRRA
ncbi:MAG TPA: choice-of-anchor E domain-containing protein [Acetobacteraceae bacterium]|jgi:hypothetical protein|nr:choice-of-anchor E domain-containing protein [Acetobacteraceae bacterium]